MQKVKWLVLAGLISLSAGSLPPRQTVRILCVGDSITQGGKTTQAEYTYRLPLQMMLLQEEVPFDFIGSRQQGLNDQAEWPDVATGVPFDPDHEGYYGHKTEAVCRNATANFAAHGQIPDIVLIHLGTNDQKDGHFEKNVGAPLRDFIRFVQTKNPRVLVLLGHLNFNDSEAAKAIRAVVEGVARETTNSKSHVITVHHYEGWRERPDDVYTDTFDWAHPNLKGQEKMAINWFRAMKPFLRKMEVID